MNGPHWAEEDIEMAIAAALLFDRISDGLRIHWAAAVEESRAGVPLVADWALAHCASYEMYGPCAPYIRAAYGLDE